MIIKMEKIKFIILMEKKRYEGTFKDGKFKELENIFMKVGIIILGNGKIRYEDDFKDGKFEENYIIF